MKNIFKKKETDEEVVELTPEEKKERNAKIWKKVGIGLGAIGAFAAGVIFSNAAKSNDSGEIDDVDCGSCEDVSTSDSAE